jgi:DNA-binding transcriptional regulator GbsR (MarR family)
MAKGRRVITLGGSAAVGGSSTIDSSPIDTGENNTTYAVSESGVTTLATPTATSNAESAPMTNVQHTTNTQELPPHADDQSNREEMDSLIARRGEYNNLIREYGRASIAGEASLLNLAETLVDGAVEGVFAITDKVDDATAAYELFRQPNKGRKGATLRVDTQSESSFKSNVKKLEWFIKLGQYRGAQGKQFFNASKDVYTGMMTDPQERQGIKLKAAYEAVLHLVRQQLMKGEQAPFMSAEEMKKALRKDEPSTKDGIDLLAEGYMALKKAYEGRQADEKRKLDAREPIKDDRLKGVIDDLYSFVRAIDSENPGQDIRRSFDETVLPKKRGKKAPGNGAASAPGVPGAQAIRADELPDAEDEGQENFGEEPDQQYAE